MKLLNKYIRLSSIEIKEKLNLSWGEYSNTITSLKKKGYISYSDDFDDNSVRRFIHLEEPGRQDFEKLTDLLEEFLFSSTDIIDDVDYNNIYP